MAAPRIPYLGKIAGAIAAVGAVGASLEASGIVNAVAQVSPRWAGVVASVCAVAAWLARAPIGRRQ